EQQQLLHGFNSCEVAYPKHHTLVSLFEQQVEKTPHSMALVFEERQLTYQELNERSNQLAHLLRSKGVRQDSLVPLCMERSVEVLIAIWGILKAGAAYVPIDPDYPVDRIHYLLQDTAAPLVVCSESSREKLETTPLELLEVEDLVVGLQPMHNPQTNLQPSHLAYVIYTSGSTGTPKGVMVEHHSLVDYYYGLSQHLPIGQCRSFALVSTLSADLGNTVLYGALLSGAALHLCSKELVNDGHRLQQYFIQHTIDCVKLVPSHWQALSSGSELLLPARLLVFGGEALKREVVEQIRQAAPLCIVVNHYGPTETTIGKLLHVVSRDRAYHSLIPIGKPFSNTRVYVLDGQLCLCAVGVSGQLYISGEGLARGYWNNEALTKEKFIDNPFTPGGRLYATGDVVRYVEDGAIEFVGRVDEQVKIRGYRIELGEIEAVVQQSGWVSQCVVVAKEDTNGGKRLVGYIVSAQEKAFNKEPLIDYLKSRLPEYMVPAQWVELQSIPLTANGKVDRKALPDPNSTEGVGNKQEGPRNEVEARLCALWQELLEVERVGVHEDFFELGGHSLLAIRVIAAVRKELEVEVSIGDVFDYPTVAQLAEHLQVENREVLLPSIEAVVQRPERLPLSFAQERLWFIDQLEGSVQYHVPAVLRLKGTLNKEALEAAFRGVIERHEVLRTIFLEEEGQSYQYIQAADGWK
ncbi:amino acid adenylation domain-containing protein, partial [Chitinophagaceae bacterium LB-8]